MAKKVHKETPSQDKPKIIIKKAKGHHGGHHGGAWKVAYADFVTAMMALFIVLWVLGASDKKFKAGLAHYFRNPGVFDSARGIIPHGGEDRLGAGIIASPSPSLEALHTKVKEGIRRLKDLSQIESQVTIQMTSEGLLIELVDKNPHAFFDLSSATIKPAMRRVLEVIVNQAKEMPNLISISGHTDSRPFHGESFYSNWELSSARALNTRRVMEELGLPSERVERVIGYADRQLRFPDDPLNAANRRISILFRDEPSKEKKNST